ncbi:Gfo/Idh/MocA family oxidoreductase [uncultured Shewanella sp.]|uniref:Gfo/Idh/MocA family protein n=1 Tax=uncultured Shewanella sp. TaxID=173975 RepID=UPI00260686F4|nr:Gfo/Idh/MocA family oxidoreductase [uncultured Shewanella sp.]
MTNTHFGIIGTGQIANVIANAIQQASNAELVAVSSRRLNTAKAFVAQFDGVTPVEGIAPLLANPIINILYIATPTVTKEAFALAGIRAGKHILIDKPLINYASLKKMLDLAKQHQVLLMDASHFVHHPRTQYIIEHLDTLVGKPQSLHTSFYSPIDDANNIRFNTTAEPMGAMGDMAWYSLRAIVEYLQPQGTIDQLTTKASYDSHTGAISRASGFISFTSGETSTFDVGYTCGSCAMDFHLLGANGMITMNDFALDWHNSFAFHSATKAKFTHRVGLATPDDFNIITQDSKKPAQTLMVEYLSNCIQIKSFASILKHQDHTLQTQRYLDAIWQTIK